MNLIIKKIGHLCEPYTKGYYVQFTKDYDFTTGAVGNQYLELEIKDWDNRIDYLNKDYIRQMIEQKIKEEREQRNRIDEFNRKAIIREVNEKILMKSFEGQTIEVNVE